MKNIKKNVFLLAFVAVLAAVLLVACGEKVIMGLMSTNHQN